MATFFNRLYNATQGEEASKRLCDTVQKHYENL